MAKDMGLLGHIFMNLLDKSIWQPTLYYQRSMAANVKGHLFDHFGWECHIDAKDDYYAVRLPDGLTSEEYCLGQSFLLAYAHGFADSVLSTFKETDEKRQDQATYNR